MVWNADSAPGPPHTLVPSPLHAMLHELSGSVAPPPFANALPQ